jgi:hypothetical protein
MGQVIRLVFCLSLGASSTTWSATAVADTTLDSIRQQLDTAAHLIEDSTAAKRVETSGNASAQSLREQARALFRQAQQALDDGQAEEANKLLADAKKTMFKAVQTAGSGAGKTDKAKHDYDMRAQSVRALLKAQGRVADEKHAGRDETRLQDQVEALLAEADALYGKRDYAGGKKKLDVAYEKLKISIERMRDGEVLEHKVVFNSAEDQYKYYWGKTGSQLEAIEMAAGTVAGTSKEKMIKVFSDKMHDARSEAKSLADRGDFDAAVKVLVPIFKTAPYQLMSLMR